MGRSSEGSEAVIPVISLVALPCGDAETVSGGTRQHQSASSEASSRYSHSFTLVCHQAIPVNSSLVVGLGRPPSNPAACLRVGSWDKPWDKFADHFETASPQFHFCPGDKNERCSRLEIPKSMERIDDFNPSMSHFDNGSWPVALLTRIPAGQRLGVHGVTERIVARGLFLNACTPGVSAALPLLSSRCADDICS